MAKKAVMRMHQKSSAGLLEFLEANAHRHKKYSMERTSTGFATYEVGNKQIYIREKYIGKGAINRISEFQNQVAKSKLYKYINDRVSKMEGDEQKKLDTLSAETSLIQKSIMYKGFFFDPIKEPKLTNCVKVDFNTAYWQTCRYMRTIDRNLYRRIVSGCTKPTRLKITGTLNKKRFRSEYVYEDGRVKRQPTYMRQEERRRIIFQNIYNRVRKFVDEMMIWCWAKDPDNFIGFYVDCAWFREYDVDLISKIQEIYDVKINMCDIHLIKNSHNRYLIHDINHDDGEITELDVKFKYNEFVSYNFFHNFNANLKGIKVKSQWETTNM